MAELGRTNSGVLFIKTGENINHKCYTLYIITSCGFDQFQRTSMALKQRNKKEKKRMWFSCLILLMLLQQPIGRTKSPLAFFSNLQVSHGERLRDTETVLSHHIRSIYNMAKSFLRFFWLVRMKPFAF